MKRSSFSIFILVLLLSSSSLAADANSETSKALRQITVPEGIKVEVFASEPDLENPVSLDVHDNGDVYVVESNRRRSSVYDIRKHPDWVDADLQFRTVAEREAFLKSVVVEGNDRLPDAIRKDLNGDGVFDWRDLEVETERVRLLRDTDGDGHADVSTVYAEGFDSVVSGVAAGVLAVGGDVWFACIPDIWKLTDEDGDGVSEKREGMFSGFGVHISYGGHDLHGLELGPDGRIYFTVADRGASVEVNGNLLSVPHEGAVFRCELDGSRFEVYAMGLRNPQDLAFDAYGNLFTCDNNADGGDKARLTYVMDGGEYGWHYGWQHMPKFEGSNSEFPSELKGGKYQSRSDSAS